MELVAIQLARVAAIMEIMSLDPKGKTTVPEGVSGFASRYAFHRTPQDRSELDFQKGVNFSGGRFNEIAIDQIQLFSSGIVIDTRSSTDDCLLVLQDVIDRAREATGANVVVARKHFISQIAFRSSLKLSFLHPVLQPIADRLARAASSDLEHPIVYEPTAVFIGPDTSQIKVTPSIFSIERRIDAPFSENTYFSAAPIGTADHLTLIEEIEQVLQSGAQA